MEHLPGFAPLADRYDGFILDLWGVIHDGVNAFPHAVDCLARLREAGKRTLLLSNVPRPNDAAQALMRGMGIPDDLYTDILTSGEAVRRALQSPPDLWWAELGQRVFHLGPERDRRRDGGPGADQGRRQPAEANFVLNTGPGRSSQSHRHGRVRGRAAGLRPPSPADDLRQPRPAGDPRRRARAVRRLAGAALPGTRRRRALDRQAGSGDLPAGAATPRPAGRRACWRSATRCTPISPAPRVSTSPPAGCWAASTCER